MELRDYHHDDVEAAIALWLRAWSAALPQIDFAARLDWWRERWDSELVPNNVIRVAEEAGGLVGFVVIDPRSGYLDQIVVAEEHWGSGVADALLDEAKRISPTGITLDVNQENERAVRFYERAGFVRTVASINPTSGRPTWKYAWSPA
jgi:putative acetyltransferase